MAVDPGNDIKPNDPQRWNMYAYAHNNPLRVVDRQGSMGKDCLIDHPANWPKQPSAGNAPPITVAITAGVSGVVGSGGRADLGIAFDTQGNVGLIGSAFNSAGPALGAEGNVSVSVQPGTVQDLANAGQEINASCTVFEGVTGSLSLTDQGEVSGGFSAGYSAGLEAGVTQDQGGTGVIMLVGDAPPPKQPTPPSSGPVINAVPDEKKK